MQGLSSLSSGSSVKTMMTGGQVGQGRQAAVVCFLDCLSRAGARARSKVGGVLRSFPVPIRVGRECN